jgi:hypothetical protein
VPSLAGEPSFLDPEDMDWLAALEAVAHRHGVYMS